MSCEATSQHFLAVVVVIIFLAAAIAAVVVDAAPVIDIINVAVATAVAVVGSALGRLGRCIGFCIAMGSREAHFGPRGAPGADPKKNFISQGKTSKLRQLIDSSFQRRNVGSR